MTFDYVVMPAIFIAIAIVVTWLVVGRMRSLATKPYGLTDLCVRRDWYFEELSPKSTSPI